MNHKIFRDKTKGFKIGGVYGKKLLESIVKTLKVSLKAVISAKLLDVQVITHIFTRDLKKEGWGWCGHLL